MNQAIRKTWAHRDDWRWWPGDEEMIQGAVVLILALVFVGFGMYLKSQGLLFSEGVK